MPSPTRIGYSLLFILTGATLALSCYIPFHIDDVMYPITASRAGYDGWVNLGVLVLCKSNFTSDIPLAMWPGRWLAWLLYYPITTPMEHRFFSIATLIVWAVFLAWMARKSLPTQVPLLECLVIITSMCFIGVVPFSFVIMRPETMMGIAIAFYALLPFYIMKNKPDNRQHITLICIFLFVSSWFFLAHPKAIFFTPLALYSLWFLRKKPLLCAASYAVLLLLTIEAYQCMSIRMQCPESPDTARYIQSKAISASLLFTDPAAFLHRFRSQFGWSTLYLTNILFFPSYKLAQIPPAPNNEWHGIANVVIEGTLATIVLFWVTGIARITVSTFKNKTFLSPDFVIPCFLITILMVMTGIQGTKNFYDVVFMWLIGTCATIILLYHRPTAIARPAAAVLTSVSVMSQLLLLYTYTGLPQVSENATKYGDIHNAQEASILHYSEHKDNILHFAAQCGIDITKPNRHIAVDTETYLPFKETYQPVFIHFMEDAPHRLPQLLKEDESDGLVALCGVLPENVRHMSTQDTGLCCLSKNTIQSFNK